MYTARKSEIAKLRAYRKELEELSQRPDSYNESIRQMIATHEGRLMALKDLRLRIRAETGVELKGTKAPPDIRKK